MLVQPAAAAPSALACCRRCCRESYEASLRGAQRRLQMQEILCRKGGVDTRGLNAGGSLLNWTAVNAVRSMCDRASSAANAAGSGINDDNAAPPCLNSIRALVVLGVGKDIVLEQHTVRLKTAQRQTGMNQGGRWRCAGRRCLREQPQGNGRPPPHLPRLPPWLDAEARHGPPRAAQSSVAPPFQPRRAESLALAS